MTIKMSMPEDKPHRRVQISGEERVNADGKRRLGLNESERAALKTRSLAAEALTMFVEKGMAMPDIAEELGMTARELGSLHKISPEIRRAFLERTISRFLDLETNHTRKEIADELGLTTVQLRYLTRSDDFQDLYQEYLTELTSDPGIKAITHGLVEELLPQAYQSLKGLLSAKSEAVKLKAALEVIKLVGIQPLKTQISDRREAAEFLAERNVTVQVGIKVENLPPDYKEAMEEILPGEFKDETDEH